MKLILLTLIIPSRLMAKTEGKWVESRARALSLFKGTDKEGLREAHNFLG